MPAFFNMGKTGDGLNSGFEGLIYVNGSPYCETGSYHEEVIFPTELAGTKVELAIRLWVRSGGRRRAHTADAPVQTGRDRDSG